MPALEEVYTATAGGGAALNGQPITVSEVPELQGATVLAAKNNLAAEHWQGGTPPLERHFRPSLAYRMALVAEGRFDAMITLRDCWEWDIAAGALIAAEAGACVTDRFGAPLIFNSERAKTPGVLLAGRSLHRKMCDRLKRS